MEVKIIEELIGKTFTEVFNDNGEELHFNGKESFKFYHNQDCCEYVRIEEVIGDLKDLQGEPIVMAEETSEESKTSTESGTWTFYKFATNKGSVTVRWLGESNGYYSESVDFRQKK